MEQQDATTKWLLVWRRLMWIVITLMLVGMITLLPPLLTALQFDDELTRQQTLELWINNTLTMLGIVLILGLAGGFALVVIPAITSLMSKRNGGAERLKTRGALLNNPARIFVLCTLLTLPLLALVTPVIGKVIYHAPFNLSQCLSSVSVVAFVDQNSNGIRDADEHGLANVSGTATVSTFKSGGYINHSFGFETDGDGTIAIVDPEEVSRAMADNLASYFATDCANKQMKLTLDNPQGYTATTRTEFVTTNQDYQFTHNLTFYAGFAP